MPSKIDSFLFYFILFFNFSVWQNFSRKKKSRFGHVFTQPGYCQDIQSLNEVLALRYLLLKIIMSNDKFNFNNNNNNNVIIISNLLH